MSVQTELTVAMAAIRERGWLLVQHPTGRVIAPGGGQTDWRSVAGAFLEAVRTSGEPVVDMPSILTQFNMSVGGFWAESWEPTHISVVADRSGHVVATFELNDAEALLDALLMLLAHTEVSEQHSRSL